jgi:ribonuclease HI
MNQENDIPMSVTIQTEHGRAGNPHTPVDKLEVRITSAEMVDDNLIFGRSLEAITELNKIHEGFQYTYGAKTAYGPNKTVLTILNDHQANTAPGTTQIHRVRSMEPLPNNNWRTTWEEVTIPVSNKLVFMKTEIDNPRKMYEELMSVVQTFALPTLNTKMSIAVVRRIISQLLIPKLSARIRLQPLSREQAEKIDTSIAEVVNGYYGWCPRVSADILMAAIEDNGFGFPSITDINAAITVKGLHRDLNHPIKVIRQIAEITMQEWSCTFNQCLNPLHLDNGKILKTRDLQAALIDKIPRAWGTAVTIMDDLELSLVHTDQSYVLDGKISVTHARNLMRANGMEPAEHGRGVSPEDNQWIQNDPAWTEMWKDDFRLPEELHQQHRTTQVNQQKEHSKTQVQPQLVPQLAPRLSYHGRTTPSPVIRQTPPGSTVDSLPRPLAYSKPCTPLDDTARVNMKRHNTTDLTNSTPAASRKKQKLTLERWKSLIPSNSPSPQTNPANISTPTEKDVPKSAKRKHDGELPEAARANKRKNVGRQRETDRDKATWTKRTPIEFDRELGLSRDARRKQAEKTLDSWVHDISIGKVNGENLIATDGSMYPANPKQGESRRVSGACVTQTGEVSAIVHGRTAISMHGELLGIILALRAIISSKDTEKITIYSDYLNIVKSIREYEDSGFKIRGQQNGRSWYKWIYKLWDEAKALVQLEIEHVKAHTEITPESMTSQILNQKADEAAKSARVPVPISKHAPWPTFEMDEYTAGSKGAYIEQDLYKWVKTKRVMLRAERLRNRYPGRLNLTIYEKSTKPYETTYLKSTRDYRIRVQAMARGGVLPTNMMKERLFPGFDPLCDCGEVESDHHIFVECPLYDDERNKGIADCHEKMRKMLKDGEEKEKAQEFVQKLFTDSEMWCANYCLYYLGLTPKLSFKVHQEGESTEAGRTGKNAVLRMLHGEQIRMTGYIWSLRMRLQFRRKMEERRRSADGV